MDEIERRLQDVAPEAARSAIAAEIGWSQLEVEENPAGAINQIRMLIPASGRIRGKHYQRLLIACSHVIDDMAPDNRDKLPLNDWLADAWERSR